MEDVKGRTILSPLIFLNEGVLGFDVVAARGGNGGTWLTGAEGCSVMFFCLTRVIVRKSD